jgi:hypothetical protein
VASGELGWTKAREVAKVATPESEERWIAAAKESSSRSLEQQVRATRQRARRMLREQGRALGEHGEVTRMNGEAAQADSRTMQMSGQATAVNGQATLDLSGSTSDSLPVDVPITVSVKLTSTQYAQYEALLETIRKRTSRSDSSLRGLDRAELLLAALHDLAENLDGGSNTGTRAGAGASAGSKPPY